MNAARGTMQPADLVGRTKRFALEVIAFTEVLPRDETSRVLGRQLLRCGTSVGANYRSAKRARSNADFIAKMGLVEEEADESGYWLELLAASGKATATTTSPLLQEAGELVAIAIASINIARTRNRMKLLNAERGMRNAENRKGAAKQRSNADIPHPR